MSASRQEIQKYHENEHPAKPVKNLTTSDSGNMARCI